MPRPPRIDELDKVSFIVNYFAQGCEPPYKLFVEFSKAPLGDLFILLGGIDWQDILKSWLRPGGGRYRDPARHGKKKAGGRASFDINEYFGSRARARYGPYPGIKLPGAKAVFTVTDQLDRINFSAAVLEGLTDVGYDTLWGILSFHPEHCPGMGFVNAHNDEEQQILGVAPLNHPIFTPIVDSVQGFHVSTADAVTSLNGDFTLCFDADFYAWSSGGGIGIAASIWSDQRGHIASGNHADLDPGGRIHLSVSAEGKAGEWLWAARDNVSGSLEITNATIFGFQGTML